MQNNENILLGNEAEIRERLLDEMHELVIKRDKLERFIERSEDFEKLPQKEQPLMIQQLFVIQQYISILDKRFVEIRSRQEECENE